MSLAHHSRRWRPRPMNCRTTLRIRPLQVTALITLAVCSGCDNWFNRPHENRFAAEPVSRSIPESRSIEVPELEIDQPRSLQPSAGLLAPRPTGSIRSPRKQESLQAKCETELRRQSDYPFNFRLTSLNGRTIRKSQFAGRLLIVDVWATWCGPCVREVPHFIDLQDRYRESGLSMVGINFERKDSDQANRSAVMKFARSAGINYPLALGNRSITQQIPDFEGYPTTLFIDGKGNVRLTLSGSRSLAELETFVKLLLRDSTITRRGATAANRTGDYSAPPTIQQNPFASTVPPSTPSANTPTAHQTRPITENKFFEPQ